MSSDTLGESAKKVAEAVVPKKVDVPEDRQPLVDALAAVLVANAAQAAVDAALIEEARRVAEEDQTKP